MTSQPRLGMWRSRYRRMGTRHGNGFRHTPIEKYSVSVMVPKYAAVNGSLGPERRCVAYAMGPWRMAQDARKSTDPTVQLIKGRVSQSEQQRISLTDMRVPHHAHTDGRGLYKANNAPERRTHSMANFRGRRESTGKRKKQVMKHTAAPRLQAANARRRSHRLTAFHPERSVYARSRTWCFIQRVNGRCTLWILHQKLREANSNSTSSTSHLTNPGGASGCVHLPLTRRRLRSCCYSHANHPASSSCLVGAGSCAGISLLLVGNRT